MNFLLEENGVLDDILEHDFFTKTTVLSFLKHDKSGLVDYNKILDSSNNLINKIFSILKNDKISNVCYQIFDF